MVALFVVAIVLCAVSADYVVQRLALRARSSALDGLFVDTSHLWIQAEPSGLARVGADQVILALLGRSWQIDWAPKGQIKRGAPLAVVYGQGRSLTLHSYPEPQGPRPKHSTPGGWCACGRWNWSLASLP
jgi:hypothetical protein